MSRYSRKKASGVYAGEGIYTGQGIYTGRGQGVFAAGRTSKYGQGVYTRRGTPKNEAAARYNPWLAYLKTPYVRDQFPAFREQFLRNNPRP